MTTITTLNAPQDLRDLIIQAHEELDPDHQGMGWPDPVEWDGRSLEDQAADVATLLGAMRFGMDPASARYAELERLSGSLWEASGR